MNFCEGCKAEKAVYFCMECKKGFCRACDEYVHKLRKYAVHSRILFDEKDIVDGACNYHPYEAATHYCVDCKSNTPHTFHNFLFHFHFHFHSFFLQSYAA